MKEIWKPIMTRPGINVYFVSSEGRVKRLYKNGRTKFLKPFKNPGGYWMVDLHSKTIVLHRLVAETFLGRKQELQVNHKDGNKANNCLSNLEWCTQAQNMQHAAEMGLRRNTNKLDGNEIHTIKMLLEDGYTQQVVADLFKVHQSIISRISSGKTYQWS